MSGERPSNDQRCVEHCAELLSEAIELLSAELTARERVAGWTVGNRRELLGLVEGWRAEVLKARTVDDLLPRIMGRWFLDRDVDYGPISELLARTDNAITDYREGPWESRKDVMADVPAVAPRAGGPRRSPFFGPSLDPRT